MKAIVVWMAAAMTLLAVTACAQGNGTAPLAEKLRRGDRVKLTLDSGMLAGKVDSVQSDRVTLQTNTGQQVVPFASVTEARRTRRGFLLGTIIGAGVGAVFGAVATTWAENEGANETAAFLYLAGIGTAAGAGIDALVNLERTVYRRQSAPRVSIAPAIGPNGASVVANLRW